MKQALKDLVEFHEKFNMGYDGPPRELSQAQFEHRRKFIEEELAEYSSAKSLPQQVDALIDMAYVIIGTLYLMGIDVPEAWRRVHESNLTKSLLNHTDTKRDARFDGVMKGPGFKPPILDDLCRAPWVNMHPKGGQP